MRSGVAIWTEGGPAVGMGHVMRCISVAKAFAALGIEVHFYTNAGEGGEGGDGGAVEAALTDAGFEHDTLPFDTQEIGRINEEIAVIDTHRDVLRHVIALKEAGTKTVLIDNYSASDMADSVIVPCAATGARPMREGFLRGPDYVIVGENFLKARDAMERPAHSSPLRVLVTMGGADPNNLTETVVEALQVLKDIDVTVVMGPASKKSGRLERLKALGNSRFTFLHGVKDMAPLMNRAHVAFTAPGITVYELAFMGVPSVILGNYSSDRALIRELERLGVCIGLGFYKDTSAFHIGKSVQYFMRDGKRWEEMSRRAATLIDGLGALRIAGAVSALIGRHNGFERLEAPGSAGTGASDFTETCSGPWSCEKTVGNL